MKKNALSLILSVFLALTMMPLMIFADNSNDFVNSNKDAVEQVANNTPEGNASIQTPFLLKAQASGKTAVKLSWTKVSNANKYIVYGNQSGKTANKIATVKTNTYIAKKIKAKKLKANTLYRFYVVAYNDKAKIKTCKSIYFITANTMGKYANVKTIAPKTKKISLVAGQNCTLGATYKMYNGKKHIAKSYGKALRYYSNCPQVATVTSNGLVKALAEGKATIYIQDIGGKYCQTSVTVKNDMYTLSFNANGGKGEMPSMTVNKGEEISIPSNLFTKEYYEFQYWNTKADGSGTSYIDKGVINIKADTTLYAQWNSPLLDLPGANEYRVTVMSGENGYAIANTYYAKEGQKVSLIGLPNDGFTFKSWESDDVEIVGNSFVMPNKDVKVTATWEKTTAESKTHFVLFDYDGHDSGKTIAVEDGKTVNKPNDPAIPGYIFEGWYKDIECITPWNFSTDKVTKNTVIYSKWKIMPAKGQLITLDGQDQVFRVIKVEGTNIEVLAMSGEKKVFNANSKTTSIMVNESEKIVQRYAESDLDKYFTGEYYNGLSDNIKAAIIPQDIKCTVYARYEGVPSGVEYMELNDKFDNPTTYYMVFLGAVETAYGRTVYALDAGDVIEYIGRGNFTAPNVNMMYFNQSFQKGDLKFCWLRSVSTTSANDGSIVLRISGEYGGIYGSYYYDNSRQARAAFTLDISKCDWAPVNDL